MRALFLILGLMLATPALAQTKVVLADCKPGGCRCSLSNATGQEAAVTVGLDLPSDWENMVLVNNDGFYFWSYQSREDIDIVFDGDGKCDLELFNAMVPEDGTWKSSVRVQDVKGCLPQVAQMLPPMVDGTGHVKQIVWGGKFHPSQFVVGNAPDGIRWTEVRPDRFDGTFPIPDNGVLDVTVTATATLTAPDTAEATMALRIGAANGANAGALAAIGMANCRVDAIYDFARIGP